MKQQNNNSRAKRAAVYGPVIGFRAPLALRRALKARAAVEGVPMQDLCYRYVASGLNIAQTTNSEDDHANKF